MEALIVITSHTYLSSLALVAGVPRIVRRILTTLESPWVETVHVVIPQTEFELCNRLRQDKRLAGRVKLWEVDSEIYTWDQGAAHVDRAIQIDFLIIGDVFDPTLIDRLASVKAVRPDVCLKVNNDRDEAVLVSIPSRLQFRNRLYRDENLPKGPPDNCRLDYLISKAWPLPIGPKEFAFSICNRADIIQAEKRLFLSLGKDVDGLVSKYINRPISRRITQMVLKVGATPNKMTVVALLVGIAAAVCNLLPIGFGIYVGAFLFVFSSILDGCDGELARLLFMRSGKGEWFDSVSDSIVNTFYIASIGVLLFLRQEIFFFAVVAVAGFVFSWLTLMVMYRRMLTIGRGTLLAVSFSFLDETGNPRGVLGNLMFGLRALVRRDFYALVLPALLILDFMVPVLFITTIAQFLIMLVVWGDELNAAYKTWQFENQGMSDEMSKASGYD